MVQAGFARLLFKVETIMVPIHTVSALIGLGQVNLLKANFEGLEMNVLDGIAAADRPKITRLLGEAQLGEDPRDPWRCTLDGPGCEVSASAHHSVKGSAQASQLWTPRPDTGGSDVWCLHG